MVLTGDEFQTLDAHLISSENYISRAYKENEDKNKEIIVMQRNMVYSLSEIVESRDANTGDHIRRTAFYVRLIAQELKARNVFPNIVTSSFIKKLTFAAPLHDVGKIAISDTILNKPGKLTKEEFDIMKTHVTAGTKIINRAMEGTKADSYLEIAKEIAEYHHERWDGTGYMKGLKGDEIPLSARIMAVSDVFDALVSKRSYKEPFSYDDAIKIIKEESGTHFDPRVVDAFLSDEVQLQIIEFLKN